MKLNIKYIYAIIIALNSQLVSAEMTQPEAYWLPEFADKKNMLWWIIQAKTTNPHLFITATIAEWIKYVWFLAIISLIVWWIIYMTSFWVDAKTKKAKNIIMYSIIWILVAITAYSLVDMVNNISLN